jgi:hypothetical protein
VPPEAYSNQRPAPPSPNVEHIVEEDRLNLAIAEVAFTSASLSASRYFGDKQTLCLYWPLGTLLITGPRALDFYTGFCANRATCLTADGKDITEIKLILNDDSNAQKEVGPL